MKEIRAVIEMDELSEHDRRQMLITWHRTLCIIAVIVTVFACLGTVIVAIMLTANLT